MELQRDRPMKEKLDALKREEIVRVAGDLFYRKGFSKTSMDEIAAALSVGKPFIYSQFPSKTDLLAEVCNRTAALAADVARDASEGEGTPLAKLEQLAYQLALKVIEGRFNLGVRFREEKHLPPYALKQLSRSYHAFNEAISQLLRQGIAAGEFHSHADAVVVAHAISGMATWLYTWYQDRGTLSAEQIASQMSALVVNMIKRAP
jgi:AcrR family transcriptional regulator